MKIIFFGTSEFAGIILNKLLLTFHPTENPPSANTNFSHRGLAENFKISTVITRPDQPVGRKKVLTPPPVKILAVKDHIPVLQPLKLDDTLNKKISDLKPDLFIIAAYGKIIPLKTLDIPRYGALNIHPSLLPKYRGPSPIQSALLNGDKITAVTIIKMDEKMDHGKIIANSLFPISPQDTYLTLSKKLAEQSAQLLIKTIPDYVAGKIEANPQNHAQATYTKIIKKQDGLIDKNKTARQIYNMYRAYCQWPKIYGKLTANNKQLTIKLLDIELIGLKNKKNNPLELFTQNKSLYLQCANNTVLKILKLQPQGKNSLNALNFINGYLR